jgi:hypothetical protein
VSERLELLWHGAVDIRCIAFVAITASENWESSVALLTVTAMSGDFAVGDTRVDTGGEFTKPAVLRWEGLRQIERFEGF